MRSCLKGTRDTARLIAEVDEDDAMAGGVGWSNARALKGVHQHAHTERSRKIMLTVGEDGSMIHALPLVSKQIRQTRQRRALHK